MLPLWELFELLGDGPWEACSPGFLGLGTTVDVFG